MPTGGIRVLVCIKGSDTVSLVTSCQSCTTGASSATGPQRIISVSIWICSSYRWCGRDGTVSMSIWILWIQFLSVRQYLWGLPPHHGACSLGSVLTYMNMYAYSKPANFRLYVSRVLVWRGVSSYGPWCQFLWASPHSPCLPIHLLYFWLSVFSLLIYINIYMNFYMYVLGFWVISKGNILVIVGIKYCASIISSAGHCWALPADLVSIWYEFVYMNLF